MMTSMEKRVIVVVLCIVITLSPWIVILPAFSAENAVLSFSPTQSSTAFPQPVTLNVTLSNVVNLNAWQIKVVFDPEVLVCSNVTVPTDNLLGPLGGTSGLYVILDNAVGYVRAFLALDGTQGVNGSGTLCQITFNVSKPGISAVTFTGLGVPGGGPAGGTALFDGNTNQIPFSALNGTVNVSASGFQSYTFSCLKKGITHNVTLFTNSTVSSFGYNETTDTIAFFLSGPSGTVGSCTGSIPLAMMNATLAVLVNGSATYFSQSSDGLNRYLLFSYFQGTVRVAVLTTLPADLTGDRKVDITDIAVVSKAFASKPGSPRWNPIADTNGDLKIDITDVSFVAKSFGKKYWPS